MNYEKEPNQNHGTINIKLKILLIYIHFISVYNVHINAYLLIYY